MKAARFGLLLRAGLIAAVVFWIYSPAFHGGWLWDDDLYITANPLLHDPARLWKTWFVPGSLINYFPITATAQWAQWQLWGNDTTGYHLTNIFLHALSALLVWRLLDKFGLRLAWLGGLLFAIHPTAVESVAWISELKNTLSLPPFLLAMCAWIDYETNKRRTDYFQAVGWFFVTMLCKTTVSMFPIVILLYAWWKRNRIGWSDLKASAPFFVISLVLGVTTILAETWFYHGQHEIGPKPLEPFLARLACAGLIVSFYFAKSLCPVGLLPIYPKWAVDPSSLIQYLPWLVLAGAICWFWKSRRDWGRHALLGLGFFLINLVPFLGFVPTGFMSFTWVMDHILYAPIIGLIGLVVAGLGRIEERLSPSLRPCVLAIAVVAMALMAFESHRYAGIFINEKTILTYTLTNRSLPVPR